jgi:N6-adenosine-specific RNA methylase IME4
LTSLAKYDAACRALQEAVSAQEVLRVHVTAAGIEAVARMAGDFENELRATKLRTTAAARLGDMITEGEEKGVIARHGGNRKAKQDDQDRARNLDPKPATLQEMGVSGRLSARARRLSGIGAKAVAVMLDRMERESRERGVVAHNVIADELGKRNAASRRHLAQGLSDATALSPSGRKFPVVYADPAWRRKAGIGDRAYENTYPTMTWDEILAMPVAQRILPDAWLFLWIPRPHLLAAIEVDGVKLPLAWAVMLKWGFTEYSTCFVWTKTDDAAPDDHGTGLITWDQDELLLLFKRGSGLPKPDSDKKHGSNHRARAAGHSAKPTYYRDMINDMTGGVPVLELFAREDEEHVLPPNFFTWGNQSKNTAEIECDESFDGATGEIQEAAE